MGRHVGKKLERKEKSKVKLRTKNAGIKKAKNITDTSFKSHKILIREQLKNKDLDVPCSKRKLTVKELLSRLQHHNLSVRQSALGDLSELLQSGQIEQTYGSHMGKIIEEVAKLILDQEREVRKSAMRLLGEILGKVETQKLAPFFKMLLSYLGCSLTHIHPNIQEDGLLMLDVLLKAAPSLVAQNACQILPSFLNMISRLKSESKPERTLTLDLGSKHVSMKWRFNVLCYIHRLLSAMADHYRCKTPIEEHTNNKVYVWTQDVPQHIPIYKSNYLKLCHLSSVGNEISSSSDNKKLKNFADVLMPLLRETWLEAGQENVLSLDAALLLKCIVEIIEMLWELLLLWEKREASRSLSTEFASAYRKDFEIHFLRGFPYTAAYSVWNEWSDIGIRKGSQQQKQKVNNLGVLWEEKTVEENCIDINLTLCTLFCCLHDTANPPAHICISIVQYTERYMKSLQKNQNVASGLLPLLRMVLMEHSKCWKYFNIDFAALMDIALSCAEDLRPSNTICEQLIQMLCEIAINEQLEHLYSSKIFLDWLFTLPKVLEYSTVHVTVLKAIVKLAYQNEHFASALEETLRPHSPAMQNFETMKVAGVASEHDRRIHQIAILYCLKKRETIQRGFWNDEAPIFLTRMLMPERGVH